MIKQVKHGKFCDMYENDEFQCRWVIDEGEGKVEKLVLANGKVPKVIVLPQLNQRNKPTQESAQNQMKNYMFCSVKICEGCFEALDGQTEITLKVLGNQSVAFDYCCFKPAYSKVNVNLILPKNMDLFLGYHNHSTPYEYQTDNWPLIADKSLKQYLNGSHSDSTRAGDIRGITNYAPGDGIQSGNICLKVVRENETEIE